ncbi:ornithine cyclodeaminase family protein [Streptomyces sp. NPDC093225]|uniref:ornithine cyclodeaminase family protein n=1 Tax=Streptomyces sp. NPDC093225 TaxID=3366034 RepID=UPI00380E1246
MTRILTRSDLLAVLDPAACLEALADGFRTVAAAAGAAGQRVRTDLPFAGTATALLPGLLPGVPAYTVKVNAKFPGAAPALRGVVCLHAGADGELLALLDSATLTAWRTGLAAALGTHVLAAPDPAGDAVLGVVGAGAQADLMVAGLRRVRTFREIVVHDTDPARAGAFAARHGGRTGGRVLDSARTVAAAADVVLLATWARDPLLSLADTRPGQHLTSLGADEPGKRELAPDLLRASFLVVDDLALAAASGAPATAGLPASAVDAVLGDVLRGARPGRTGPGDLTVYAPVGLPWQDLAVAWWAYRTAAERGLGTVVDLLG